MYVLAWIGGVNIKDSTFLWDRGAQELGGPSGATNLWSQLYKGNILCLQESHINLIGRVRNSSHPKSEKFTAPYPLPPSAIFGYILEPIYKDKKKYFKEKVLQLFKRYDLYAEKSA